MPNADDRTEIVQATLLAGSARSGARGRPPATCDEVAVADDEGFVLS
ncbi:hypothetical protein [Actinomycetospora sp. CA-053990]